MVVSPSPGLAVPDTVPPSAAAEEQRMRLAWAKRPQRDPRYAWSNAGHVLNRQERERAALRALARHDFLPLASKSILEVGCGTGGWLRDLVRWGAQPSDITGIDLLPDRISEARRLCPPGVRLECGSATQLPWATGEFDLVLQATTLTAVLDLSVRHRIAGEMRRVLKPGGLILWYDFRFDNPWNRDVRGIGKREIRELFPDCTLELRRLTLAPPLARWVAPRSRLAAAMLASVPLLRTHYLGVLRPPEAPTARA
jgi:ubiquinone/menaquinone biosynthesis C-methylase UbiE